MLVVGELALGVEASDPGVELGLLLRGRSTGAVSIPATHPRSSGRSSLSAGNGCGDSDIEGQIV